MVEVEVGISCRATSGNVGTASGLSVGMATLTESATASCLVVPNPLLTHVGAAISTSTGFSDTVSGRESISAFSDEVRLSRTCDPRTIKVVSVTDVGRTRHYGRRNKLTGRWYTKSDSLAGIPRPTLRCGFSSISTSAPLTKMTI